MLLFAAAAVAAVAVLAVRPAKAAPALIVLASLAPSPRVGVSLTALAWVFLKAGALLFGLGLPLAG